MRGVGVCRGDRFEGAFLAERSRILRAENVEIGFGSGFFQLFLLNHAAKLADFFRDSADALIDRFEFEGKLSTLSAKGFDLNAGVGDFGFEAAGFAVSPGETLFGLRELIAQTRRRGNIVENGDTRILLPAFTFIIL